jgi:hypothetical protein
LPIVDSFAEVSLAAAEPRFRDYESGLPLPASPPLAILRISNLTPAMDAGQVSLRCGHFIISASPVYFD